MTLLIHIPNEGKIVREMYDTKEQFIERISTHSQRLREQFPEFAWLLDYRDELGGFVADLAFPDAK